ncbi:DeoR/GlpR family DNA-binding transcription regulator [Herbaspirillum sp. NPDC087042]|uniref:DeoR/GlpR family DNA-binding transcription regulator n=1 Tax=Herbaspirillum sp. NPDC087042 TaxID=3364004 RepID=UPI0038234D6B
MTPAWHIIVRRNTTRFPPGSTMKPTERREQIVRLVRESQRMSVEDLSSRLAASKETVRRDLQQLAEEGRIRKLHGSAVLPEANTENPFQMRMAEATPQKRAIAACAARLFAPGDSLFIDTGTTTLAFAEELANSSGLTVITNSTTIAHVIARGSGGNKVFLLGGEYREESSQNVGSFTLEQIARFRADHAVLTVGAISSAGVMNFAVEEADVAHAMVRHARSVTVLADSSKLGREALFPWSPLAEIDRLVTDRLPHDGELKNALAVAGVEIVIADH